MGKYKIIIKPKAEEDLLHIKKSGDKNTIRKLEKIFKELSENPYEGTGHPEALKHQLSGFYSRRINRKDRIIYQVFEIPKQSVVVVSALGHYL